MVHQKMIKYTFILIFIFVLVGCSTDPKKIERHPFKIDHSITGFDLVSNGYRWMPGVDVILLGKKTKDTLDYYEVDFPIEALTSNSGEPIEEFEEVEMQVQDTNTYIKELKEEIDPLDMPDTMYNRIWLDNDLSIQDELKNGIPINRYFYLTMTKDSLDQFINSIDEPKYKLSREIEVPKYYLDRFLVINLHSKDTFTCSVTALENGKIELLSYCSIKN